MTKQSALQWADQTIRFRMYRAARDTVMGQNIKSEIKEFNTIDFNGVQTFTMQNYCYKTQSFSGERKSFPIKCKSVATTQSSLGERKRFSSECKCFVTEQQSFSLRRKSFVTERKGFQGSTKILWPNAKFLWKVQKYCDWTQSFSRGHKGFVSVHRFFEKPKSIVTECKFFSGCKSFVTKCKDSQGSAKLFQVNAKLLWPNTQFLRGAQKFCKWMLSL